MCKRFMAFTVICAGSLAATAQTVVDSTAIKLDDVVVWGSTNRKEIVPAQRLIGAELEALSSSSVGDAIRYFSGVQLKDYGGVGGLKTVDVRSMGTNHMGVFYDGIQLGNAQNGQVDLSKFSLDNVESISLYNGQKSDILQSAKDYAAAGVIYIRTRRPQFAEGKNYNVRASLKAGSFGVINPSFLWEQKWSARLNSSFNTEYLTATGKYKFRYRRVLSDGSTAWDTTAVRQNGDMEAFRLEGGLFGRLNEGVWNAKVYYYTSNKGIPGAIVNNVWKTSQRQWDHNFFAQGQMKKSWGRYELMLNGKFAWDYLHYLSPDTTSLYINNVFRQTEAYISVANHYSLCDQWDVAVTADYQFNALNADLANFVYPKRHTFLWAAASTFEWGRFKAMGNVIGTHAFDVTDVHRAQCVGKLTPALFLSFQPVSAITLRAYYKQSFRQPTFNDLYYTDIGNISLEPEFATQYNVGATCQQRFGQSWHFEGKVDAYFNKVDNKIVAIPKGSGQYRWMMMNIGKVKILGVDVSAQTEWNLLKDWTLNLTLNYTYQRARDYTDPTDNDPASGTWGGQIAYIPWHSGSVVGNLRYKRWMLNYSFIYVGERYHNSANIRQNHEEPWYTHDVKVGWNIQSLSLSLEINNLLNQQYDVVLNYPMPGRNWKCIVKYGF